MELKEQWRTLKSSYESCVIDKKTLIHGIEVLDKETP